MALSVPLPGTSLGISPSFEPKLSLPELSSLSTRLENLNPSYVAKVPKVHRYFSVYKVQNESKVREQLARLDTANRAYDSLLNVGLQPPTIVNPQGCTSILDPECTKDYVVIMPLMVQEKECDVTFVIRKGRFQQYVLRSWDIRTRFMGLKQELERMSIQNHARCPAETVRDCKTGGSESGCKVNPELAYLKNKEGSETTKYLRGCRKRLRQLLEGVLQRVEGKKSDMKNVPRPTNADPWNNESTDEEDDSETSEVELSIEDRAEEEGTLTWSNLVPSGKLHAVTIESKSHLPRIVWLNGIHRPKFTFYTVGNIGDIDTELRSKAASVGRSHSKFDTLSRNSKYLGNSSVSDLFRDSRGGLLSIDAIIVTQLSIGLTAVDVTLFVKKNVSTNMYEVEKVDIRPRSRFKQARWVESLKSKLNLSASTKQAQRIEPLAYLFARMASEENEYFKRGPLVTYGEDILYEKLKYVVSGLVRSKMVQSGLAHDTEKVMALKTVKNSVMTSLDT